MNAEMIPKLLWKSYNEFRAPLTLKFNIHIDTMRKRVEMVMQSKYYLSNDISLTRAGMPVHTPPPTKPMRIRAEIQITDNKLIN